MIQFNYAQHKKGCNLTNKENKEKRKKLIHKINIYLMKQISLFSLKRERDIRTEKDS